MTTEDYRQGYRDGWQDATAPTPEPPFLLPQGTHTAMLTAVEPRKSKTDRDILNLTFKTEYAGRNNYFVWATAVNKFVFTATGSGKPFHNTMLTDLYYALGVPIEEYSLDRLLTETGKTLKIVVTHETYNGQTRARAIGFQPLSTR